MGDFAKAFVVGSSLPAVAVTYSYLAAGQHYSDHEFEEYEMIPLFAPATIGAMNALMVRQIQRGMSPRDAALLFGAGTGLMMSLIGHEVFGLPGKIFRIPEGTEWLGINPVHWIAPVLYATIFSLVLRPLNKAVLNVG